MAFGHGATSINAARFAKEGERLNRVSPIFSSFDVRQNELMNATNSTRAILRDFASEPFRIFFPAGVLAGIVGVALWPLHLLGVMEFYPGLVHARIMACGLFGGFIFGFLGTAMPRMLSAKPLRVAEVAMLLAFYIAMVAAFACS